MRDDFRYSFSGADCRAYAYFPNYYRPQAPLTPELVKRLADLKAKHSALNEQLKTTIKQVDKLKAKFRKFKGVMMPKITAAQYGFDEKVHVKDSHAFLSMPDMIKAYGKFDYTEWEELRDTGPRSLYQKIKRLKANRNAALLEINQIERMKVPPDTTDIVHLDSMATISFSVHEPKGIVRALGYRGPKGFSRSVRTIAGSMIFIVVEGHPLERLLLADPAAEDPVRTSGGAYLMNSSFEELRRREYAGFENYARDNETAGVGAKPGDTTSRWIKPPTMLTPFSLVLKYVSEYTEGGTVTSPHGSNTPWYLGGGTMETKIKDRSASLHLKNIEFINEGIVTSVNDMVTEVVYQFVAQDYHQFHREFANQDVDTIIKSLYSQNDRNLDNSDKILRLLEGKKE